MLARIARQCSRQLAAQQAAALHLSAPVEARRKTGARKDDSDEEDAQQNPTRAFSQLYQKDGTEADWEWDTPFDATYTRNPGEPPGRRPPPLAAAAAAWPSCDCLPFTRLRSSSTICSLPQMAACQACRCRSWWM